VYFQWDAASNSRLNILGAQSPAHLRAAILDGSGETEAKKLGSAIHMSVLEPELFSVRYLRQQQCSAYTEKGKGPRCTNPGKYVLPDRSTFFCGTHRGEHGILTDVTVLSADDAGTCEQVKAALARKRRAANLIGAGGDFEVSIVWHEQVDIRTPEGERVTVTVPVKARLDYYSPNLQGGTVVDVKSAEVASEQEFTRAIFRYRYYVQGGLYLRGCRRLPRPLPAQHFCFLAVEKKPPYEVGVFRLTEGALDAGEEMAMKYLRLYAQCQYTGEWPGYPDRVRDVALPDWAWKQMDDELQQLEEVWPQ